MSNPFTLPDGNVKISFSGGRTSGYMLHEILCANGDLPERVKVLFANTGREMPETLDFVQECSERWSVPITWLEYSKSDGKVGFNVVSHNSASRNGEPFTDLINSKRRLPNVFQRFCTEEMKVRTMRRYLVAEGWKTWSSAIGIRADEPHRAKQQKDSKETLWWPLLAAGVSKFDVAEFWGKQQVAFGFDLRVTKGFGNCDGCFLKSEKNLAALWRMHPERAAWWAAQEDRVFPGKDKSRQHLQMFKQHARGDPRYSELGDFVERQGDWIFDDEDFLCQANDGECTG